ncbi:MAG: LacI family DNA-binding transcriptional regulator [Alphaproteobacteria bacterium]|nr:LacI family DNA-binding transcriptional regulator [Alphaproteobacteria bacterium]MDE1985563.1 LacI family DNA-binding transcriptional regulator [Alphaproteobacteria bacterium]MDE2162184.1 LacI family DNA-binding transcriptional regulator [Alphaproteobacteria bacterium]MDE2265314.1 LacI family DNA-binding transcriptional regulator [Alphaproteobacteria bacterium]MDE2498645.1 LacI family DNA-binding transcriptional regulator [Alphaproteobacteria bacterium]
MTSKSGGKSHSGRPQKIATIYDVARRARVSKTTVSRVVNGEANVREETRDAVLKAVRALQFRPNKAARSLASAAEARVGLVYCNPSVAYFNELLIGALDGSGRNGMQLVVDKCEIGNADAAVAAVRHLVKGGLNGMVLTAPVSESRKLIAELMKSGVAVVSVATGGFRGEVTCVGIDDCRAAYEMTNYILKLGHRRLGFIKGHPSHTSSTQRFKGFEQALRDTDYKAKEPMVAQGYFSYRSGLDAAEKLLSGRKIPTAIFASNDEMASAVMSVAHRKGLDVPRDLSVVGFDDTIAGSVWPQLTTIRQPIYDIASTAIDIIADNIRSMKSGARPKPINRQVPHLLIERESTAPPPPDR